MRPSLNTADLASMEGRTCMITGSNSGIGKATAIGLVRMGATVVMVCRDRERGEAALSEIEQASGTKKENIELMLADLSSLDSVRQLADDYSQNHHAIHVLINNAGLILGKRIVTNEGFESTFVVNYLSHFLLTNLMMELLKSSAPSRVINVSSSGHTSGHIDFDDLQAERKYSGIRAYCQSKLAQVLFTYELAKRLEGTGVTANCVHPGAVATNWGRRSAGLLGIGVKIGAPFLLSAEKGADTSIYLASSPEVAKVSGKYFVKRKETASSSESYDETQARKLWEVSSMLTGRSKGTP